MRIEELLLHVSQILESLGSAYFVTGPAATIAYGEPRFTNDIDMLVSLSQDQVSDFCAGFPAPEFFVSPAAVADAVCGEHQFNVIHPGSGLKVDFIVLSDSAFDKSRTSRIRKLAVLPNQAVPFASPEDVILKKLMYFQEGGSDKHLRDIAGVLRIQGESIDRTYIADWAGRLGVLDIWKMLLNRIGEL